MLFDRSYEDSYTDPGSPVTRRTAWGTYILARLDGGDQLLMQGLGASPEGNRPFLDVLDLSTKQSRRLWQSQAPYFESAGACAAGYFWGGGNGGNWLAAPVIARSARPATHCAVPPRKPSQTPLKPPPNHKKQAGALMSDDDPTKPVSLAAFSMLISRETPKDPPQSYVAQFVNGAPGPERQLTNYPHPYPTLRDMNREVIRYDRDDGVTMTATLYTPPGTLPGLYRAAAAAALHSCCSRRLRAVCESLASASAAPS